jgi:putative spermidine/putrescine transport system ATP-binding protein
MAADTKDAPGKAQPKGFSLRSRLLGLPTGNVPGPASPIAALQPRDDPPVTPVSAPKEDAAPDMPESASEPIVESKHVEAAPEEHEPPQQAPTTEQSAPDPLPNEETDEEDEPPRVGLALTPRRSSLLSVAFGFGDRKIAPGPKIDAPKSDVTAPAKPAAQPTDVPEDVRVAALEPDNTVAAPTAEAKSKPVVEAAAEPLAARPADEAPAPPTAKAPAQPPAEEVQEAPVAPPVVESVDEEEPAPIEHAPAEPVPFVRFAGVKKTYDGVQLVVKDLNLDIAKGEFLTLLGPSGSGKTTTLMMLAGFEQPTAGEIMLNGNTLTATPPHKRGLGFVFQNYALFPHMTVAENLAFPLEVRKVGRGEIKERVARALSMVELGGFEKRKPHQLSGGQQQRVAVARALVFDPELVLMDEPLGALDKHLREQMQYELKRLHRELGVTVVYVTHDQGEALTLSDRIAVFHDGVIQQLDTPKNVYDAPSNAFVAGFIGENNALPGKVVSVTDTECTLELIGGARVRATNGNCDAVGRSGVVCVRPEHLILSAETQPDGNHVAALIEDFIFHGDHLRVKLSAPGMNEIIVKAPARGASFPAKGVAVTLSWEPTAARAFVS